MAELPLKEQLILDLYAVHAVKFGAFTLKSGVVSPYYLDLRVLVSYPYLLELVATVFWQELRLLNFDVIVGVPYTAIPIATAVALRHSQTMIFVRKERKGYGTNKLIEGEYHAGQLAVIIDDVITNGDSKFETIKPLEEEQLIVKDVVVLLDRGQGGPQLLEKAGYHCRPILTMDEIFSTLLKHKRIGQGIVTKSRVFMKKTRNQFVKGAK